MIIGNPTEYYPLFYKCNFLENPTSYGCFEISASNSFLSLTISSCVFSDNTAFDYSPVLSINCTNNANILNSKIINSVFNGNRIINANPVNSNTAGICYIFGDNTVTQYPTFTNCTFYNNAAAGIGAGVIYNNTTSG